MQHYKVCCSKQFPTLFSLPQACPCCMLCTICVKNAARDELLLIWVSQSVTKTGWAFLLAKFGDRLHRNW